ncbi:hypothetical protein KPL74_17300 [Bacillus sp. NP157]|nr:hypothetical protein KPL74_17300 [Bacillus sp. NP157]
MSSLKNYYFLRALVAFAWVAIVVLNAPAAPLLAGTLLVLYPAWDALANLIDARRSGGLAANPGQRVNAITSAIAAVAMAIGVANNGNAGGVLVFGLWALAAGVFQLAVGIRRRKLGGQVFMMISGAQSALAGVIFSMKAFGQAPGLVELAPYAAFGGFYFLLSALWITFKVSRAPRAAA